MKTLLDMIALGKPINLKRGIIKVKMEMEHIIFNIFLQKLILLLRNCMFKIMAKNLVEYLF